MPKNTLFNSFNERALGDAKERLAEQYLRNHHVTIIERNYHCRFGEIDLIAQDENSLVFTEIRYRKNKHYGGAAFSVDTKKQKKLIASAQHYLQSHKQWQSKPCRFDVVALEGDDINWIKNAFQL